MRSLFQNWRTGRRGRRFAARARRSGTSGQRLSSALSPNQTRRSANCRAQHHHSFRRQISLLLGRDGGHESPPECNFISSIIRHTSTATRSTATPAGDYPDNAERFALFSRAVLEASKILGVPACIPLPRLAVGARARDAAHALCRRSRVSRSGHRFHHPQHGIPGSVSARYLAAADAALGSAHDLEDGIFRPGEFSEGRARVLRLRHHGQQEIQSGDSDHRIWIWPGRRAAQSRRHCDRHSERRRLRRVEPADRQVHRREIFAAGSERQAEMQTGFAARLRRRERRRNPKCR